MKRVFAVVAVLVGASCGPPVVMGPTGGGGAFFGAGGGLTFNGSGGGSTSSGGGTASTGGGSASTGGGSSSAGGGASSTGGGASSTGGGSASTGGGSSSAGGGSSSTQWTQSECETSMDKFVSANCSDRQNWVDLKGQCTRLSSPNAMSLCTMPVQRAKACHAQFVSQGTTFCNGAGTDTNETCGADVILGVLCAATVNVGACAGVACQFNSDCPSGWTCNDRTDRCVRTNAPCPGLPCQFNSDCPTGLTCNGATGQCNAQ